MRVNDTQNVEIGQLFPCETEQVFSVEVIPDAATEAVVVEQWHRLIEAGLPSAGRHSSPSNRPHVTIAVRERLDPGTVETLRDAPGASLPLDLRLGGAVVFAAGERFVLARPVVVSRALLDLHAECVGVVGPPPPEYAVTAVDRWTPHVTLARRMTADQVGRALAVVGAEPVDGAIEGLRVWDSEARELTTLR